ncbi:MAG: primosomal protein N' [Ruminococcus sp.]|nr:primosomal protein N' [Ruminococcus sp.]
MSRVVARVGVSGTSAAFDTAFSYAVPDFLRESTAAGVRVTVPFGKGDHRRIGIVVSVQMQEDDTDKLKEICSVIDREPVIGEEQLRLLEWLHETVFCTYFEAFRALIPPGLGMTFAKSYRLSREAPDENSVSRRALELYRAAAGARDGGELAVTISSDSRSAAELIRKGFLEETDAVRQRVGNDTVAMVRLTGISGGKLTPKQKKAADILAAEGCASVKELCYLCGCTAQVIKNMVKSGAAEFFDQEELKVPDITDRAEVSDIILSESQRAAFDGISRMIAEKKPSAALLFGVTGSGKTPVFAKLIEYTLGIGRNVLMLIPEISLTPQTVNRFRSLFGETVAVMHSGLSLSMRSNEYKRIRSGACRIAVGTRSAVFAPMDNIGLIIIDEEGERTYKSEASPRYHAKDAAAQRCLYHGAVLLTASATPSVESYYSAVKGRSRLFVLPERYSPDRKPEMPRVDIIDMTGSTGTFSSQLIDAVNENLERGEQSILLLNRRGYHTYACCTGCKAPVSCPQCDIPLTYHKVNGRMICHYCGYSEEFSSKCSACGGDLKLSGIGTQRLEEELEDIFPSARILRMDADTTYSRYAYDKRFTAFGRGEYDIMAGTQMIAKGLDFPNVTLVGALGVDKALFSGDFRSYERTFSLITQAVGRCGRNGSRGRAVIQTFVPEHYVINLAAMQDYPAFYRQEIAMRQAMIYPPFCDICVIGFSGTEEKDVRSAAEKFAAELAEKISVSDKKMPVRVLGPSKCALERLGGRYRYRIIIKCRNNSDFRSFIRELRARAAGYIKNVSLFIDINGDISL